jgi:hypothetical protein
MRPQPTEEEWAALERRELALRRILPIAMANALEKWSLDQIEVVVPAELVPERAIYHFAKRGIYLIRCGHMVSLLEIRRRPPP